MKKLIGTVSVLGKLGIALTFVLPTIGFAEDYSTAIASPDANLKAIEQAKVLKGSAEFTENVNGWQKDHQTNQALGKAINSTRSTIAEEISAETARLETMQRLAKSINMSGMDKAVQGLMGALSGIKRKECKEPANFQNLFGLASGMKDFIGNLGANFSKQTAEPTEDLQAKAARLTAEAEARFDKLEAEGNPAEAQLKQKEAALDAALKDKDPKKLLAYMQKEVADARGNQAELKKSQTRTLRKLLNSPTGLVNLRAAIAKDDQIFQEFGTLALNATENTLSGMAEEVDARLGDMADACDTNHKSVVRSKRELDPVIEKFNNPDVKKANKEKLARAEKTVCSPKPDLTTIKGTLANIPTNMRAALANNDAVAFFQGLTQAPNAVTEAFKPIAPEAKKIGQECDANGVWVDFFKQNSAAQDLKKAAQTGDMSSAIDQSQQPGQPGQQPAQLPRFNASQPTFASPNGIK